jgi:hypothetical protein
VGYNKIIKTQHTNTYMEYEEANKRINERGMKNESV